jgi:hypothetical protein
MGQRFRLKANFDTSGFSYQARVILEAMKSYGLILADNGSDWYISGVPDERWDNDQLHELGQVHGDDFEAVDVSDLMADFDSAQVKHSLKEVVQLLQGLAGQTVTPDEGCDIDGDSRLGLAEVINALQSLATGQ